jgi:hypothetical protein
MPTNFILNTFSKSEIKNLAIERIIDVMCDKSDDPSKIKINK